MGVAEPAAIYVANRFPALRARLLDLLTDLSEEDWGKPTAARLWSVKDVAAHLWGGDVGNLSRRRDAYRPAGPAIKSYEDLVALINTLNAEWVQAARRLSPHVLANLLANSGPPIEEYFASLDPNTLGEPVSWAGPDAAPVWLDIAREFTERWHHQQQIRDATGRPPLYAPYFLAPVLDTFVRALPHTFRNTEAECGTVVRLEISGEAGGTWFVERTDDGWRLLVETDTHPAAEVILPQDAAWRLFTRGLSGDEAKQQATVRGNPLLTDAVFGTISVLS